MTSKNRKQPVTLKDVAEAVGYSVNTVSRALREKDDISKKTRERIKHTAIELGYISNAAATSLRLGYTSTIAVILGDISNPHFAIIMKEIEDRAGKLGYTSFLLSTNEDEAQELRAIQSAVNKNVDGIILCPTQKSERNIAYVKATGVPFVLIGRHFHQIETDYVVCDDELGGYQATKFLLENGHRDILILTGPSYISSAQERLSGYCKALNEYGVPVRDNLILETAVTSGSNKNILSKLAQKEVRYSAIFAFSDLLAWEAWTYLEQLGKRVPEDCSLVGFDYIQSRIPLPFQLSTISSHKFKMSVAAVDLLIEQITKKDERNTASSVVITTELVKGNTVRNIASSKDKQ